MSSAKDPREPAEPSGPARQRARRDPERTRREILEAAIEEFSRNGLLGGRIDAIAEQTNTTKRMIYYYFESKEQLYTAALIDSYRDIRESEANLPLDSLEPVEALQTLIRATLTHFEHNANFIRLVTFENALPDGGIHLFSDEVRELNRSALVVLDKLLRRGREQGVFRSGPDAPSPLDVHQVLSGLTFYRQVNRLTFRTIFGRDMLGPQEIQHVRDLIEETVMRLVLSDPEAPRGDEDTTG